MIKPIPFTIEDFFPEDNTQVRNIIGMECLTGSELVDNLILLRFCTTSEIKKVLQAKYNIPFHWLNVDPTPPEFAEIARKHNVAIERGRSFIVYVPLGVTLDDALLSVDIPQYQIKYCFIADCNLRVVKSRLPHNMLTFRLANYRPMLVFRRLVMECIKLSATDLHFASVYDDETMLPKHCIEIRKNGKVEKSFFGIDLEMMSKIIQTVVAKLSPASAADLDSDYGVTTEVKNLFDDGSCDLRISGSRIDAGWYFVFTIQTRRTTNKLIHELGFPKADADKIFDLAQLTTGLTLVTGKMRTGKNTTIFAIINELKKKPIRIIEYSNPIENHTSIIQVNYHGDIELLKKRIALAKKQDIDIAYLNELPNAEVAFAVRDLVNSAVGVITTTHMDRVWHLPLKLQEFFGKDYKTVISQLNCVINHKMFYTWKCDRLQKRTVTREQGDFEKFCYNAGIRQHFIPEADAPVTYQMQPLVEILVLTDAMKTAMLNFEEVWRAEEMIHSRIKDQQGMLETKVAAYVNAGLMSIEEMRKLHRPAQ